MSTMAEAERELELRDYLRVVWGRRRVVLGVTAATITAALAISLAQAPVYRATSELELPAGTAVATAEGKSVSDVETALFRLRSDAITGRVHAVLGSAPPVTAASVPGTPVLRVTVESSDPKLAARAADTYAVEFLADRRARALAKVDEALARVEPRLADAEARHAALWKEIEDPPAGSRELRRARLEPAIRRLVRIIDEDSLVRDRLYEEKAMILAS